MTGASGPADDVARLREKLDQLGSKLAETEETLRAIRRGEIDALVVEGPAGDTVYTLHGAEQPYRVLIEHMQEGALTLTAAGDLLFCNRAFAGLVGAPLEQVIGGPFDRFVPDQDRAAVAALLREGSGKQEGRLRGADGRAFPVLFSLGTFVSDGVEIRSLVVSDLREILHLQTAHAEAQSASRAKDEFLAMLGHELRNPLAAMRSAAHVISGIDRDDARASEARDVIVRQTEHLTRLVDDLLDVGRITSGRIVLHRCPVDLADVARRAVGLLSGSGRLDHRLVSIDASAVWVEAEVTRLEQIVLNLLDNAVKFTPAGGTIRLTVRDEGPDAVLTVSDTGIGIDAELLPVIFDLFVQGTTAPDRAGAGLGIGLTVVRRLVELHGGTIEAASGGSGRGSAFTVRLGAIPAPTAERGGDASMPGPAPRRRITLIEDNRDVREMLRVSLELSGHEVHEAPDGASGLETIGRVGPEVVLIDIGLPDLDGYEVARRIRAAHGTGVVLVALTGYGRSEDEHRAYRSGFDHHLVKPVDPDRLADVLNEAATGLTGRRQTD